jgi:hypothetical protein
MTNKVYCNLTRIAKLLPRQRRQSGPPCSAEMATVGVIDTSSAIDTEEGSPDIVSVRCTTGAEAGASACDLGDFSAKAASRKTPSTGSGVLQRGGRGPCQLPTLGALDRHRHVGEADEAHLSRLPDRRTNTGEDGAENLRTHELLGELPCEVTPGVEVFSQKRDDGEAKTASTQNSARSSASVFLGRRITGVVTRKG